MSRGGERSVVQWARDSAYRFFPLVEDEQMGLALHPFDLATNKVLAMAGRVEAGTGLTCSVAMSAFSLSVIWCGPRAGRIRGTTRTRCWPPFRARTTVRSKSTRWISRGDAVQAALFQRLRDHYQKRDRLRLVLDYRKKYLDSLIRGGEEEAAQAEENYERARTQAEEGLRGDGGSRSQQETTHRQQGGRVEPALEETGQVVSSRPFRQ